MAANEIHINDIGTQFKLTISDDGAVVDVSTAIKKIKFLKPDGTCMEKTATNYSGGTDGIISYITESADLDVVGTWKIQAFVDFGDTEFYSDVHSFRVHKNIC